MAQFERHYTLPEANALLPRVREILRKIAALLEAPPAAPKPKHGGNGHQANGNGAGAVSWSALSKEERQKLARGLVQEIEELGIVIQDLRRGLIDFPAWREAAEVFLCYELADGQKIRAWHELHAGFAGRQPIEAF